MQRIRRPLVLVAIEEALLLLSSTDMERWATIHVRVGPESGCDDSLKEITARLTSICHGHSIVVMREPDRGWVTLCDEGASDNPAHLIAVAEAISNLGPAIAYRVLDLREFGVLLAVDGKEVSRLSSIADHDVFSDPMSDTSALPKPDEWVDVTELWMEVFDSPAEWKDAIVFLFIDMKGSGLTFLSWGLAVELIFELQRYWLVRTNYEIEAIQASEPGADWVIIPF